MPTEAARVEITIPALAESVWMVLTNPASMKRFFMGASVMTTWDIGSAIQFTGEWEGKKFEDKGTITTFQPPHILAFTHLSGLSGVEDKPENYHVVTFRLAPSGDQTQVVLTQTNLNDAEPLTPEIRQQFTKNWGSVLDGLRAEVLRTRGPRGETPVRSE